MKNSYISLFLAGLTLLMTACEKDTVYNIDPGSGDGLYTPLSDLTLQMNNENLGSYACDGGNDYFPYYEYGRVSLYKKERATGALTLLDRRAGTAPDSGGDVSYTDFCLQGGYLYFMLFDYHSKDLQYVLCRVDTRGGSPMEKVADLSGFILMIYSEGKAYAYIEDGSGKNIFYEVNLPDGTLTPLFDTESCGVPSLVVDGYLYCRQYTESPENGRFYARLNRCRMDGSGLQTVLDDADFGNIFFTAWNGRLYIYDTRYTLYSTAMDGSDRRVELENTSIWQLNTTPEALYLLLEDSPLYKGGVYTYRPGYKRPMPLYQGENLNWYFMLNGYGEIILPVESDATRFGQLQIIRDGVARDIK